MSARHHSHGWGWKSEDGGNMQKQGLLQLKQFVNGGAKPVQRAA
jgi:hypothetical protein